MKLITNFFKEVYGEYKKVTWPSKEQTIAATIMVVIMVIFFAVFIGLVDYFLTLIMGILLR
ncbi:MAG: preprotein translocase subunit SecE [bacterium]|nr:preprotein translocase subunit SecE [bacterium]